MEDHKQWTADRNQKGKTNNKIWKSDEMSHETSNRSKIGTRK